MKTIILFKSEGCWMADFGDDPDMQSAFGCGIIPTAFTERAPSSRVMAAIQRLNPQCVVQLAQGVES